MKMTLTIFLIAAIMLTSGCSMKRMATNVIGKVATEGYVAVEDESDVEFARESAPALIKTLEVLHYGNPKDARSLTLLARAYGQYAFGFVEEKFLKRMSRGEDLKRSEWELELFYNRGKTFGMQALSSRGIEGAKGGTLDSFRRELSRAGKKDVPPLFWTAFSWAGWINRNLDDPAAIVAIPKLQAIIDRVIELDDVYYCGAAHALKGVLAVARPKMLGGDPKLALAQFDRAREIEPNFLMTRVLFAQYFARQTGDRKLFKKTLSEVIEADASLLPNHRLSNELAKRRAKILLKLESELF